MRAVTKSTLGPSGRKFVALALADYADDAWECFPQVKALAAYTGQSERTVREHLDAIEAAGIIIRKRVRRSDGTLSGYRFAIQQDALPAEIASGEKAPVADLASGEKPQQPAAKISTTSGEICRAGSTKGSTKEDPPTLSRRNAPSRQDRFPEFWDAYPHRDAKRNRSGAEKSYRKALARGVPEQTIIDAARQAHSDPRVKSGYARDPTTWLNQAGWDDEIAPNPHPFPRRGQTYGERLDDAFDAAAARLAQQPIGD